MWERGGAERERQPKRKKEDLPQAHNMEKKEKQTLEPKTKQPGGSQPGDGRCGGGSKEEEGRDDKCEERRSRLKLPEAAKVMREWSPEANVSH